MSQLTIKLKQEPRRLSDVDPSMHPELDAVVSKAIATAPDDRYPTARAFGEALADAATQALGVGWLEASGVRLHAASHLVSITERAERASAPRAEDRAADEPRLATTLHDRIGPLLAEAREQIHAEDAAAEAELIRVESNARVAPASSTLGGIPADRALVPARPDAAQAASAAAGPSTASESELGARDLPATAALETAGWFPDPSQRHEHRYWDGAAWTDHVADQGFAGLDPLPR